MKKTSFFALGFLTVVPLLTLTACSGSNGRITQRSGGADVNSVASGTPPPYNAGAQNPVRQAPYGPQRNNTGGR